MLGLQEPVGESSAEVDCQEGTSSDLWFAVSTLPVRLLTVQKY